jgi:collagenase-like PrtC family protease
VRVPRLKSPAGGTLASVRAAVDNGADEVYVGVRLGAGSPPFLCTLGLRGQGYCYGPDEVHEAAEYCRGHGVDLYVCLNNHYSERMFKQAQDAAVLCYEGGARHFIVTDLAFMDWLSKTYPDAGLNVSIMGGSTNRHTTQTYRDLGARRVTLETCFTVDEIARICDGFGLEVEVFVFGSP